MKFFIQTGGGAGDMIKHYFWGHLGWQYLDGIKKKYPNSTVKLFTTCCNMSTQELFDEIPEVDEYQHMPWRDPNKPWPDKDRCTKGYIQLSKAPEILNISMEPTKPKSLPLTKEEEDFIASQNFGEQYIVMHPFAGDSIRRHLSLEQYFMLAKRAINQTGCNIVVLGGSSTRSIGKITRTINEEFPFEHKKIINLVNQTNMRTSVEITRRAALFIGNNSCLYCVRLAQRTQAICFNTKKSTQNFMKVKLEIREQK